MPAASRTPKRAPRVPNFEALGERGRRTGATLKDTGIRDEHGLEPVPSFSSPAKSPVKQNGVTIIEYTEETMDIGDSTIPEPTDVRRTRNSNLKFPLPQATTPRRTNLGSSPRRSVGAMPSSAQREETQTPTRASSHPASGSKRKLLDLSTRKSPNSVERTPQSSGSLKRPRTTRLSGGRTSPKKNLDLSIEEDDVDETMGVTNGDVTTNGHDYEDTAMPGFEEDSVQMPQNDEDVEMGEVNGKVDDSQAEPGAEDPNPPKKKRGRPPKNAGDDSMLSVSGTPRGRRTKVHVDAADEPQAEEEPQVESSKGPAQKGKRPKKDKTLKPVPAERGPNAKMRDSSKPRGKMTSRSVSRARFIERSETPGTGENGTVTRSGRHSIQPLAHWRGERAVFEPGHIDKSGLTLGGMKEVIRLDEIIDQRPKKKYSYRRPPPRTNVQTLEDLEEDDEEQEPWELETGVVTAPCMTWDTIANHYNEDEVEQREIAYAAGAIEMRDISGAEFRFAKTLTLPFFGSGMVDLPPGGFKRSKNARKMQMVFFMFYGRVTVEVGTPTKRFSIGKGGMWQVPRGNFYAISNPSNTPARIFFAQGNEVIAGTAGGDVSS